MYKSLKGTRLSASKFLIKQLTDVIPDIIVLSGNGIANIILFKTHASVKLQAITKDEDCEDEDISSAIKKVAKHIVNECKEIKLNHHTYVK